MLRTFIQVSIATTTVIASFFLIKGVAKLSFKDVAQLSSTFVGYNENAAKSFCCQRADYIVGFALLLLSFFLQMVNLIMPIQIDDFAINNKGLTIALLLIPVILIIAFTVSHYLYKGHYRQVEGILKNEQETL